MGNIMNTSNKKADIVESLTLLKKEFDFKINSIICDINSIDVIDQKEKDSEIFIQKEDTKTTKDSYLNKAKINKEEKKTNNSKNEIQDTNEDKTKIKETEEINETSVESILDSLEELSESVSEKKELSKDELDIKEEYEKLRQDDLKKKYKFDDYKKLEKKDRYKLIYDYIDDKGVKSKINLEKFNELMDNSSLEIKEEDFYVSKRY